MAEFEPEETQNIPYQFTTTQEWQLHMILIKTQKSANKDPLYNHLDPINTERIIHSSEASEQTHKFVQNYISLNLDQVMESKNGTSGYYLKYLITVIMFISLMSTQMNAIVSFALETPTYICTSGPNSTDTFECLENEYCQQIYHPFKIQQTFDSYTKEFNLHCDMPTRQLAESFILLIAALYTGAGLFSGDFITRTTSMRISHFGMLFAVLSSNWIENFWGKIFCIGIGIGNVCSINGTFCHLVNETTISMSELRKKIAIVVNFGSVLSYILVS